jgi:nicotinate-nucleotide adenylyltransferase
MAAMTGRRQVRIGILGGTFNPVHLGHLLIAQDALEQVGLDEVTFIPCAIPPHKTAPDLVNARDRLAMLRLALRGQGAFTLNDLELRRGGASYSIDTVTALRQRQPGAMFYFIIGADSLGKLDQWKEIGRLATLCTFVVVARPGCEPVPLPRGVRCRFVRGHACEIASRDIRARLSQGRGIRYLVPDAVLRYIERHKLYQGKGRTPSKRAN